MSALLDRLATNTAVLKALQLTTLSSLGVLTGIAASLYGWAIPLVQQSPDARTKIAQFNKIIAKGYAYLQPSSRVLTVSLASLTLLFYRHPNPVIASRWKYYALAMALVAPAGPWEEFMIFPINDKIAARGEQYENDEDVNAGKGEDKEVDALLRQWQIRHIGRIVTPLSGFLVGLWSIIAEQKL